MLNYISNVTPTSFFNFMLVRPFIILISLKVLCIYYKIIFGFLCAITGAFASKWYPWLSSIYCIYWSFLPHMCPKDVFDKCLIYESAESLWYTIYIYIYCFIFILILPLVAMTRCIYILCLLDYCIWKIMFICLLEKDDKMWNKLWKLSYVVNLKILIITHS